MPPQTLPPSYQAPQPAHPYLPPVPKPLYQPPVSKSLTIKMMAAVSAFMIIGTVGMLGLSAVAHLAHNSLTYSNLRPYDTAVYHIDIPEGWTLGNKKDRTGFAQVEFYDGQPEDDFADRAANLQLSITLNAYELPADQGVDLSEFKARSQATLEHRLTDYEASLHCRAGKGLADQRPSGDSVISYDVSLPCETGQQSFQLYGRYAVNSRGDLIIEVFHATPKVWYRNETLLRRSFESVRVAI